MNMKTTLSIAFLVAAAPAACTLTRPVPADVRVPPDLLRGSTYTAGGESPRSRYVVRMTDGHNDWEWQLPETATAYQVAVPLTNKPSTRMAVDMATLTAADREILQEREAAARAEGGEPEPAADSEGLKRAAARDEAEGKPAPK